MFYTYLWLREDGTPYYVGKGKGKRAFRLGCPTIEIIKDFIDEPDMNRIIVQEWPSEKDAFAAEKFLIAYYGRKDLGTGILINLTDGGEGAVGAKRPPRSEEWKSKQRQSKVGRQKSEEHKNRIGDALRGKTKPAFSDDHRKRIGEGAKKRPYYATLEFKERMRAAANKRWKNVTT